MATGLWHEVERARSAWERELRARWTGLKAAIARAYLPQTWVIVAGDEAVSVTVAPDLSVTVRPGRASRADGTLTLSANGSLVEWATPDRIDATAESRIAVRPITAKGRIAWIEARRWFGRRLPTDSEAPVRSDGPGLSRSPEGAGPSSRPRARRSRRSRSDPGPEGGSRPAP